MGRFSGIESFVYTAEQRSFRAAARRLGVSPAAVSKSISRLEEELGARLLNRTSRHVSLTPEGELYLRHCREALDRLQAGRDLVTRAAQVAEGRLKVSLSFVLGRTVVTSLHRLTARYPRLQVHLSFTDREVSLAEEEIDVAVRIGDLADSSLVGRRLRAPRWVTVASPAYLARQGEIREIPDLDGHACLRFARPSGQPADWVFQGGPAEPPSAYRPPSPVQLDRGDLLIDAAVAGLGVAQVFDFMAEEPLRRGELVEVLRHRSAAGPPVHALCLPQRRGVPRIRVFIEFLGEIFGASPAPSEE